ncbi:MAG: glycosyltransferase family 2 protein [Phycisphaerales bacterium]|jgi:glycosyltransferase involved in cell wall biosynthesis|nr:glycosyltransferase family 2 protein [Phycisphaerales bacterium]
MSAAEIISWVLGVAVVGTLCFWVGFGIRLWKMVRTKPTIREGLSLPDPKDESVSIVIPAHNEERVIDRCATSLRSQSHRNTQIIFVLDRCTDQTLSILQKHAQADDRVTIIENENCPEGWAGKCNAARLGAARATGTWLLFSDADTKFDTELVRCAVASAIHRKASLLSILSTLTVTKMFERIVQPLASTFLVRQYPVDRVNRESRTRPFANGQFLLFSRSAYEAIGGHEAVKEALLEDIAFAKVIDRETDGKVQLLLADGMLKCSMYPTFHAFQTGWKRIYIESHSRDIKKLQKSGYKAIFVGVLLPLIAVAGMCVGWFGSTELFWTSIATFITSVLVVGWLYKINGAPIRTVIFSPLGSIIVAYILFGAASMLRNRTPICWGGKEYILEPR